MASVRRTRRRPSRVAEPNAPYAPRRILLDTHVWLWWAAGDRRLGQVARSLVTSAAEVRFSAASAWEIAIKQAIGKLKLPPELRITRELERDGFIELPVSVAHSQALRELPVLHRDPFDRMLIAQALVESLAIVSADDAMARYGISIIDARA